MLKSTSSATTPALSPSSCSLNPNIHASAPPPLLPSFDLLAQARHHHPAQVFPFPPCHHLHAIPPLDPCPLRCSASIKAPASDAAVCQSFSSNHSSLADPHSHAADCSPRSVIRHVHSSSSGPSPDRGPPSSNCSAHYFNNAGTQRCRSEKLVTKPGLIHRPHFAAVHGTHGFYQFREQQNQEMVMESPAICFPSWASPPLLHLHHCLHANSDRSIVASDTFHNEEHTHDEAESDESRNQDRRSPKQVYCNGGISAKYLQQRQHCLPTQAPASTVANPCTSIELKDAAEWNARLHHAAVLESTSRNDSESHHVSGEHLYRHSEASAGSNNFVLNLIRADHLQRLQENRSRSCDLHSVNHSLRGSSRRNNRAMLQEGKSHTANAPPYSEDEHLDQADGVANHNGHPTLKGNLQLGSKWEDAEKWLRPASHRRHPHAAGRQGLLPSLPLLRMSGCMNARHAISQQFIHPAELNTQCNVCQVSAHKNCTLSRLESSLNHSLNPPFLNSTSKVQYDYGSTRSQADDAVNPLPLGASPFRHVNCVHPCTISYNPNITHSNEYCGAAELATTTNQGIMRVQQSKQSSAIRQQLQNGGTEELKQERPFYNYDSCDSCRPDPTHASGLRPPRPALATSTLPLPYPEPRRTYLENQFADRFARAECLPNSSNQFIHGMANNRSTMMGPVMRESVAMPIVSLREAGTQMSSIDGSRSISRYTSKNGSPQKVTSPTRHNTPAQMRSLAGSASNSGNVRQNTQQFISLEELVQCHRAKLELQALSEGERIHSFHRTTSNWSSREIEEADLSRSLRHSTPELENESTTSKSYKWPAQSYSWNKHDAAKLVKLQIKEAQIKAWEEKKKSKADAKLKKLEESLAKRRSQTTARIMASLAAAQRKAEEMRTTAYSQQKRQGQTRHRFRPRSLSPLRRCTCFSVL